MAAKIFSCFVEGLEAAPIEVEVDILQGLPGLSIVGLGDAAVHEAKERIRSAIKNSDATYPQQKKIINLAPAHIRKNGACFDVPMALGLLAASGQIQVPVNTIIVGELALDGEVRPIKGAISIAIYARKNSLELFLPHANFEEARLLNYPKIFPVKNLKQLINHFSGKEKIVPRTDTSAPPPAPTATSPNPARADTTNFAGPRAPIDMNTIQDQGDAKRALEIAAAGGHHTLLYGPPGTGKTLLARAMQSVLPPLCNEEALEVMQIYSAAGMWHHQPAAANQPGTFLAIPRPFRQIHQSCTRPALIGGGAHAQPGEITLAHHGILFFDEIAEAPRYLLESLRQPLEERQIQVSRLNHHVVYPAAFTLIAAMNPCPCGYYNSTEKPCICTNSNIVMYHKKLSGPIMDRFDLFIKVSRQPVQLRTPNQQEKSSAEIQKNIIRARKIQQKRNTLNSQITANNITKLCRMEPAAEKLITKYANAAKVSMRSFHSIIKVARTIADLNNHDLIQPGDAMEAFTLRMQPTSPLI